MGPDISDTDYLTLVDDIIDRVKTQRAELLIVSAGFDTSENEFDDLDDTETLKLSRDCFFHIGRKLSGVGIPILCVQEGGYNVNSLGKDVAVFLYGMDL